MFQRGVTAFSAVVVMLIPIGLARGEKPPSAEAVISRAIDAAGGADRLARLGAFRWSENGTYYGLGDGLPYTAKVSVQWPDRSRMEITGYMTLVLNRDQGWINAGGGDTNELDKIQLAEQKENRYAGWLESLLPLRDKAFKLEMLGDATVADKPAVAIKVTRAGHREVRLYFDKASGLLVKTAYRAKDSTQGGNEFEQESFYSGYKKVDGIETPMKIAIHRDGKRYVESEVTEIKRLEKLPDDEFKKP